jgi:hypothetical protein
MTVEEMLGLVKRWEELLEVLGTRPLPERVPARQEQMHIESILRAVGITVSTDENWMSVIIIPMKGATWNRLKPPPTTT